MRARLRYGCGLLAALAGCGKPPDLSELPRPVERVVDDAGSVISVPLHPAEGCPATAERARWGAGTAHGDTVAGHETWSREGSPHRVPNGIHLLAGATLTVEPCAVVLVGHHRDIVVQGDAWLRAEGTPDAPIVFGSAAERPSPGDWMGLELRARAHPGTRFAHVTIEHAGAGPVTRGDPGAAVRAWIDAGLDARHLTMRASAGYGVALMGASGFSPRAVDLRVVGSQAAVYFADADAVRTLPDGRLGGNASDEVFVAARGRVVRNSGTWRDPGPGARYRVRRAARILVQGASAPVLTIAPATRVSFEDDAELDVGMEAPGALVADGRSAAQRVILASERTPPAPASWVGLRFGPHTDEARSRVRFAAIEGAGAPATGSFVSCPVGGASELDSAGMLFLQGVRGVGLVTETRFVAGPAGGVAVLRSGDFAAGFDDFTQPSRSNDFASAGVRCRQNTPPTGGRCPTTARCD